MSTDACRSRIMSGVRILFSFLCGVALALCGYFLALRVSNDAAGLLVGGVIFLAATLGSLTLRKREK